MINTSPPRGEDVLAIMAQHRDIAFLPLLRTLSKRGKALADKLPATQAVLRLTKAIDILDSYTKRGLGLYVEPHLVDWAAEFVICASKPDPIAEYHRKGTNMLPDSDRAVAVTARGLVLGRYLGVPSTKPILDLYGPDNYMTCLGLSTQRLTELSGKRVLDLGCGSAMFAAEASIVFGVHVTGVDMAAEYLNETNRLAILRQYVKNIAFMQFLVAIGKSSTLALEDGTMLRRIVTGLPEIVAAYLRMRVETGDATKLQLTEDRFDCAMTCFMLMYLTKDRAKEAVREMVRVTREGGHLRICSGFWIHPDTQKGITDDDLRELRDLRLLPSPPPTHRRAAELLLCEVCKRSCSIL